MKQASIIIPVYNVSNYLNTCISSCVGQTYEDVQIVIVDDGSTDGSSLICDQWKTRFPEKICVIHKENGGVSSARNVGLDAATGDYIFFVDGDDTVSKRLVETVVQKMIHPDEMVVFQFSRNHDLEDDYLLSDFEVKSIRFGSEKDKVHYIANDFFSYKAGWEVFDRCYWRNQIVNNHIRFIGGQNYAEDVYFNFCYLQGINQVTVIPDCLYQYRVREGSAMNSAGLHDNYFEIHRVATSMYEFLSNRAEAKESKVLFPLYYYRMIENEKLRIENAKNLNEEQVRSTLKTKIPDWQFFDEQMARLVNNIKELERVYGRVGTMRALTLASYYRSGDIKRYRAELIIIRAYSKLKFALTPDNWEYLINKCFHREKNKK